MTMRLQSRHTTYAMKTTALPNDKWTVHCGGIKENARDEANAIRVANKLSTMMGGALAIVSLNSWPFDVVQADQPIHAQSEPSTAPILHSFPTSDVY